MWKVWVNSDAEGTLRARLVALVECAIVAINSGKKPKINNLLQVHHLSHNISVGYAVVLPTLHFTTFYFYNFWEVRHSQTYSNEREFNQEIKSSWPEKSNKASPKSSKTSRGKFLT